MDQPLTSQQLLHNSYHLSIRSSLLAIQCILSRQETILQSNHYTVVDIKSASSLQNATLQRITKTLAETFPKISSYKPQLPQPSSATSAVVPAGSPPKIALATTPTAGTTLVAPPKPNLPSYIPPSIAPTTAATAETISAATPQTTLLATAVGSSTVAAPPSSTSSTCPPTLAVATRSIPRPLPSPPPMNSPPLPLYPTFAPTKHNVHYQSDLYYSRAAVFKALCATQNSSWHIELKENNAHNVFVERKKLKHEWADAPIVFVELNKSKYERKTFIFDPGGMFHRKRIFDLEDKVDFKGSVMIR